MTPLKESKYVDDIVIDLHNRAYSTVVAPLKNGTGAAVDIADICGWPVKLNAGAYEIAKAADAASVVGTVLRRANMKTTYTDGALPPSRLALANGATTTDNYLIVVRQAILNVDKMPAKDAAGDSFNYTTIEGALKSVNPPILLAREPQLQSKQTT